MKVREKQPRTYIAQLESERAAAKPQEVAQKKKLRADVDAPRPDLAGDRVAIFEAARVPEKVAAQHRASLEHAGAELAALGALIDRLDGFREKQVSRTLEQFFKVLGGVLSRANEADRKDIAQASLAAMLSLAEKIGSNELLVPSLTAATGLADSASRLAAKGRLALDQKQLFAGATEAVLTLAGQLEGRRAQSAAINVLAPLVERLEISYEQLTPEERKATIDRVVDLLARVGPREGFDLAMVARFAELVAQAASEHPGNSKAAVALVEERFLADRAGIFEQTKAGLGAEIAEAGPLAEARRAVELALLSVLAANPAGSDALFAAIDRLRALAAKPEPQAPPPPPPPPARPARPVRRPGYPYSRPVARPVARPVVPPKPPPSPAPVLAAFAPLVEKYSGSPIAGALISLIAERTEAITAQPVAVQALAALPAAPTVAAAAKVILEAEQAVRSRVAKLPADVEAAVQRLAELPEAAAWQVALAFLPVFRNGRGSGPLLSLLIDQASSTRPDDPLATFGAIAARHAEVMAVIGGYPQLAAENAGLAQKISLRTAGSKIDTAALKNFLAAAQLAKQQCPLAQVSTLIGPPGLFELLDPRARFGNPPSEVMALLLPRVRALAANDRDRQQELAALAIKISIESSKIVGGKALHHKRIAADWTAAAADPGKLHFAARGRDGVAIRAEQKPTLTGFLEAHPELPLDFALTAGIHLSPEQLSWVCERISTSRGRDTARALRDLVFACVDANRLDLVEALRTSASPPKAISAVITEAAQNYRNNQVKAIAFDELIQGLAAGGDPHADAADRKTKAALAALKLDELNQGAVDPRGLAQIGSIAQNIGDLLSQYKQGFKSSLDPEIDMAALRPIFLGCLQSVLDGTWPTPKYENEVGKRILAQLTPEQQMAWRQSMITPAHGAAAPQASSEALLSALSLAKGLLVAIPREAPDVELDPAAADALRAKRDQLHAALLEVEKGTPEHRRRGTELGQVNAQLAVIELMVALEETVGGERGRAIDPRSALSSLRAPLESATAALKRLGAKVSSQAAAEILIAASELGEKTAVRTGKYAADEDGLVQLVDSNKSGCLSMGDKRRRWGICGALADPNIRMLRVYDGDKQRYRAFLKFFTVELPGYKGPALWLDNPVPDGGGKPEDLALMYKHIFEKARAMGGIPVISAKLSETPKDWKQQQLDVSFHIDDGNTGLMHSDSMFGGKGLIRKSRGKNPVWVLKKKFTVAMPPKPAAG